MSLTFQTEHYYNLLIVKKKNTRQASGVENRTATKRAREWDGPSNGEFSTNDKCNVETEMYSTCGTEIEYVCVRAG